jgi:hypothetical protein
MGGMSSPVPPDLDIASLVTYVHACGQQAVILQTALALRLSLEGRLADAQAVASTYGQIRMIAAKSKRDLDSLPPNAAELLTAVGTPNAIAIAEILPLLRKGFADIVEALDVICPPSPTSEEAS